MNVLSESQTQRDSESIFGNLFPSFMEGMDCAKVREEKDRVVKGKGAEGRAKFKSPARGFGTVSILGLERYPLDLRSSMLLAAALSHSALAALL